MKRHASYITMLAFLLLAAIFTTYLTRASEREHVPSRAALSELSDQLGPWRKTAEQTLDPATLEVLKPEDYLSRTYTGERGAPVFLFIGYYASQRNGQTYHSPQNCLPGAGFSVLRHERLPFNQSHTGEINHYLIGKGSEKMLTLYWYQARGRMVASEYWGKIYTVQDAVTRGRTDGALVRVMLPVADKPDGEERALADGLDFVRRLMPELPRYIPD